MVTIRSPVTGDRKFMPKYEADLDWEDSNSSSSHGQRTFQDLQPTDLLTKNNPLMQRSSRKVNEARPATVVKGKMVSELETLRDDF